MRASMLKLAIAGVIAAAGAAPAFAGGAEKDRTVEQRLRHQLVMNPDDPVVLAQLARLYAATDRPTKAKRLYSALMTLEDVRLERTVGTPVSSRWLAKSALAQLEATKPVKMGSR